MKVYTDPRVFDLAGAVEKLPLIFGTPGEVKSAKATGTDGNAADADQSEDGHGGAALSGHRWVG